MNEREAKRIARRLIAASATADLDADAWGAQGLLDRYSDAEGVAITRAARDVCRELLLATDREHRRA